MKAAEEEGWNGLSGGAAVGNLVRRYRQYIGTSAIVKNWDYRKCPVRRQTQYRNSYMKYVDIDTHAEETAVRPVFSNGD